MADYSLDYQISHDAEQCGCSIFFRCFDTPNSMTVFGLPDPAVAEALLLDIRSMCLDVHRLWSFSSALSDIARINDGAGRIKVDVRTCDLLRAMVAFHNDEPLFDFTVGPVSLAWKRAERTPTSDELARAMAHVGVSNFVIGDGFVEKADAASRIDVGGAAKGYVADAIVEKLRNAGVNSADVDLGGNLYLLGGHPQQRPWRLEVKIPEGVSAKRIMVDVSDRSAVTSGSYERFVEIDGKRYQHIIDPRTGWPSESNIVSATVLADSSLRADMLATTACLAGAEGFFELAARHPECDFIAILSDGVILRA